MTTDAVRAAHAVTKAVESLRAQAAEATALAVLDAHEQGVTNADLARALGVHKSRIVQWIERGRALRGSDVPHQGA